MASYAELYELASDGSLVAKVTTAVAVEADTIRQEADTTANHANRLVWAARAFGDPPGMARRMIWAVLASNKAATKAQIVGATDASVQSAVSAAVNIFATG